MAESPAEHAGRLPSCQGSHHDAARAALHRTAQHLAEWQHNPQDIDQAHYKNRALWRHAVLENTLTPTVLSQRGGPFWV